MSIDHLPIFIALRNVLVKLYPYQGAARVVVDDAGVDASHVVFSESARINWHNILVEATRQNRLDDLLKVTLNDYGKNPELTSVYAQYRQFVDRYGHIDPPETLPASDQLPSTNSGNNTYLSRSTVVALVVLLILLVAFMRLPFPKLYSDIKETPVPDSISTVITSSNSTPTVDPISATLFSSVLPTLTISPTETALPLDLQMHRGLVGWGSLQSRDVALGDVDQDGDLDAFIAKAGPNELLINDGTGTFSTSKQDLGSVESGAVSLGDLDNDGDLDAFVGNTWEVPDEVWRNDGTGQFSKDQRMKAEIFSAIVVLGDLDNDNDLDAVLSTLPRIYWNMGYGVFEDSYQTIGIEYNTALALGDLDGDDNLDAFVGYGNTHKTYADEIWLNDGKGSFKNTGQQLGALSTRDIALGDLDKDGDLDAFVGSYTINKVWLNDGSGNFTATSQSLGNNATSSVALDDLDGDGDLDAFVVNDEGESDQVWLNNGDATFQWTKQKLDDSWGSAVALGDLDNDGDIDAYIANYNQDHDTIWFNLGLGFFEIRTESPSIIPATELDREAP